MRVMHVDHSSVLGGAERSVLELARAQLAAGDDPCVAVGRAGAFSAALETAGVPSSALGWHRSLVETPYDAGLLRLALGIPAMIDAVLRLRRAIRRLRPDVVHAHTRKAQLVASIATVSLGVPLVWHLRDDVPDRAILKRILRAAVGRADHAVALSRWLAGHYLSVGIVPRSGMIGIVPSGVDPTPLANLPTPWLDGQRGPVVGFVGNLSRWKAPHLLVEVAERLSDLPDVRFAIVGDVWFRHSDGGYGDWLARRIDESPARSRIERLSTRSPAEAFAALDVLVHTSAGPEPLGRVIVEAMMSHRPVVAFPRGAPLELLTTSTGWLADGYDSAALAATLRILIVDPARARAVTDAAATFATQFAPARVAAEMRLAYAELGA